MTLGFQSALYESKKKGLWREEKTFQLYKIL